MRVLALIAILILAILMLTGPGWAQLGPSQPVILCNADASICPDPAQIGGGGGGGGTVDQGTAGASPWLMFITNWPAITTVTNANLDVPLSTRTKPSDQQHGITDLVAARGTEQSGTLNSAGDFLTIDMANYNYLQVETSGTGASFLIGAYTNSVTPVPTTFSASFISAVSATSSPFMSANGIYYSLGTHRYTRIYLLSIVSGSITVKATPILGSFPMPPAASIIAGQGSSAPVNAPWWFRMSDGAAALFPAGASPANGETNTVASLTRIGSYNYIFNGTTWDRWTGGVSQVGTWTATPPTLTKGTQGATGFSTQDLKDAGRTYVVLRAQKITGVTTEALATFTKNVGGTDTTGQTAYTVTNGKRFRIQSITAIIFNTTTVANNILLNIRVAGSVSASSPIVWTCAASALAAIATVIGNETCPVDDGIEIVGDGTLQIGVSHLENVTTAAIASFTMAGYEF